MPSEIQIKTALKLALSAMAIYGGYLFFFKKKSVPQTIKEVVTAPVELVKDAVEKITEVAKDVAQAVTEPVKEVSKPVVQAVEDVTEKTVKTSKQIVHSVKNRVASLATRNRTSQKLYKKPFHKLSLSECAIVNSDLEKRGYKLSDNSATKEEIKSEIKKMRKSHKGHATKRGLRQDQIKVSSEKHEKAYQKLKRKK
jgi:hypothetical protein